MQTDELDPVAAHLVAGYLDTAIYSRAFRDEHLSPPSLMAKVHHLLSIVQARVTGDDKYEMAPQYAEYGRVLFADRDTGRQLILRSSGTVAVERATATVQMSMFNVPENEDDPTMVVYKFTSDGVELAIAPTVRREGRKRLFASRNAEFMGIWPYLSHTDPPPPFDQADTDPFSDVGDLGFGEGGTGSDFG